MSDKHTWDFCRMCGYMVRCYKCGNNSCNGGHGELEDGSECDACDSAYEMQQNPSLQDYKDLVEFLESKCKEWDPRPHPFDAFFGLEDD